MENNNVNIESSVEIKKLQQEIKDLKEQYVMMSEQMKTFKNSEKQIEDLKEGISNLRQEVNQISSGMKDIAQINVNIQELNKKLSSQGNAAAMMMPSPGKMKGVLRKTAVATVSSVMTVVDTAMEKAHMMKEGIEDIVAEAQYKNSKRRIDMSSSQDQ